MRIQRNNSQVILLLAALSFGTVLGFHHYTLMRPMSQHKISAFETAVRSQTILHLNTPPQFPYDDDDFDASPFGDSKEEPPLPTQGIPKLKLPTPPQIDFMEILKNMDFKEILKRIAALAATAAAFVAIQKLGLAASEILTPELTAEQVKNFEY